MRKLDSLQLGRIIAVLSVLVFHLTGLSVEYVRGYFYAPWTQVLRAGVDIFFVISGVVMVVTTYPRMEREGTGKRFLIHRLSRIYPPYLFLTAILAVFWFVHPDAVNSKTGVDLFSSFTLWPSANRLPLVQVGWTLSFEMMFYLVFFCMIVFVNKTALLRVLLLWSLVALAGAVALRLDSSGALARLFPRAGFLFSPYVLEFVAGCFIGLASLDGKLTAGRTCAATALTLFLGEAAVFQMVDFNGNNRAGLRVLLFALPAALLVYGLLAMERKMGPSWIPRWTVRGGDMSYSIYLVHLLVIHAGYRYAVQFFKGPGALPLFLPLAAVAAIAASIVFYKLIERPLCRWARIRLEGIFSVPQKFIIVLPSVDLDAEPNVPKRSL